MAPVEIVKKYKVWLFILAPVALVGAFFYRMGHNDAKALADFSASYEKFDKAISDFSFPVFASNLYDTSTTADLERKADEALAQLNAKACTRISSLTKNDAELMSITHEIADLSGKELNSLKAYKRAISGKNADFDRLTKEFGDLKIKRKAGYTSFLELAGLKN